MTPIFYKVLASQMGIRIKNTATRGFIETICADLILSSSSSSFPPSFPFHWKIRHLSSILMLQYMLVRISFLFENCEWNEYKRMHSIEIKMYQKNYYRSRWRIKTGHGYWCAFNWCIWKRNCKFFNGFLINWLSSICFFFSLSLSAHSAWMNTITVVCISFINKISFLFIFTLTMMSYACVATWAYTISTITTL